MNWVYYTTLESVALDFADRWTAHQDALISVSLDIHKKQELLDLIDTFNPSDLEK